ncbi:Sec-independent protein translocase subunit TatA/TatB [Archaeoglobus neptunius]|uniref:Sec-independent protein translocase subunit TatA/TatB n=1 Tax=Archaeoglobus neptunius TaxID=2798580 RepID=UPI0019258244|nr:twin-arginine translocase TatA/TatE family subunit [Archaeoglobus neptunius]
MLGWGEVMLVLVIAVLFMGPEKLTDFARELGKLYAEYKKAKRMIELEVIYGIEPISDEELEKKSKENLEKIVEELTDSFQEAPPRSDR